MSFCTDGPRATKLRPSTPSVCQLASDDGEPERCGTVGATIPSAVLALVSA